MCKTKSIKEKYVIVVFLVGLILPFASRLVMGLDWAMAYMRTFGAALLIGAFNMIPVVVLVTIGTKAKKIFDYWCGVIACYGFLFIFHASLDLSSDAQASIALLFIPIYSIPVIYIGMGIGALLRKTILQEFDN